MPSSSVAGIATLHCRISATAPKHQSRQPPTLYVAICIAETDASGDGRRWWSGGDQIHLRSRSYLAVSIADSDTEFAGSIPAHYRPIPGPVIFEPYAIDLAERCSDLAGGEILETAAGTGVLTRELARLLPDGVAIIATDLKKAMLGMQQPSSRSSLQTSTARTGTIFEPNSMTMSGWAIRLW